jgi:hypothetical protein
MSYLLRFQHDGPARRKRDALAYDELAEDLSQVLERLLWVVCESHLGRLGPVGEQGRHRTGADVTVEHLVRQAPLSHYHRGYPVPR